MKRPNDHYAYLKMQELAKFCRLNGLPVTPQRQAVLEALAKRDDHPSADDLFDEVKGTIPGISRTTVYRVLETLVKIGVAQKIGTHESRARFDADTSRHPHLVCVGCGLLLDCGEIQIGDLMPADVELRGFRLLGYSVQFTGLCADCLAGGAVPTKNPGGGPATITPKEDT